MSTPASAACPGLRVVPVERDIGRARSVPDRDTALFELIDDALSGLAGAADDENGVVGCVGHTSDSTARSPRRSMAQTLDGMSNRLEGDIGDEQGFTHRPRAGAPGGRPRGQQRAQRAHRLRRSRALAAPDADRADGGQRSWTSTKAPANPRCRCCSAGCGSPTQRRTGTARSGDHIIVPQSRHGLQALEDSAVLLTVAKAVGPHV